MRSLIAFLFFMPCVVFANTYYDPSTLGQLTPPSTNGITYYVDPVNGDDSRTSAVAQNIDTPWKTIAHAFYNYYDRNSAGNGIRVLLKSGIYRESVVFPNSWTHGTSYETGIILAAAGDGEVIIDPSHTPTSGWAAYDANIYYVEWPSAPTLFPWAVILNDDFKSFRPVEEFGDLDAYGEWFYNTETYILYIHTAGVDPATLDPIITEVDADRSLEQYPIKGQGIPYITVSGLTLRGGGKYGFTDYKGAPQGDHVKVEHCCIKFNNSNGARIFSSYSIFDRNYFYANMLFNWPRGRIWGSSGGWGQGATISNYGTATGNIAEENGGEGIGIYGGDGYTTFENNISSNNYSVGLYLDNAPYCTFKYNFVYAATPDLADRIDTWMLPGGSTLDSIAGRMTQYGILVGDESATNPTAQGVGHIIDSNIIIGGRSGFGTYGQATGSGLKSYIIVNNTIILPTADAVYGEFYGMYIDSNNTNNTGTIIQNNIVYRKTGVTEPLMGSDSGAWVGITLDNNIYYAVDGSDLFSIGAYPSQAYYNFSNWQTQTSQDANSSYTDPSLGDVGWSSSKFAEIETLTGIDLTSYAPTDTTGDGSDLGSSYNTDFDGRTRTSWTVGALEYGAPGPTSKTTAGATSKSSNSTIARIGG